ncbi:MAG: ribosome hibernation-promoting factor, HPF/YfiA family [Actinomycetota bacterium]
MQVIVKGRNTHVPAHLKELATHKLEKVNRFLGKIITMEIEFSEEHNPRISAKHTVEVVLTTKAHVLRAHASGPDAASAIDMVLDKLEAQVKRLKSKFVRRGSRTARAGKVAFATPVLEPTRNQNARNGQGHPIESSEGLEAGEGDEPRITRVTRFTVKPMTAEEAVLQMETLGHAFYLFVNAESEQAGVVYRRRDGSYGLIEPD